MSNTISATFIGKRARTLEAPPQFDGYSKVVIQVNDELEYVAGSDTGRTLTFVNPWGTQQMADDLLSSILGYAYQPYTADGAILDPAAELGDGVTIKDVYSGIFSQKTDFTALCPADISAPSEEEIDHEYPYKSPQERKVTRKLYSLTAELKIQAGLISAEVEQRESDVKSLVSSLEIQAKEISAKVSSTGGTASSFGWTLTDSDWTIRANNATILRASKSGLEVTGTVIANGGKIGGLDIKANAISYNNMTWGGTNTNGMYIGPSGIQLGKNFKVDASGNLSAVSGTFSGTVKAGKIEYGDEAGYLSGSGISSNSIYGSRLVPSTVTTRYTSGGINTSLGYADFANTIFSGAQRAAYLWANTVIASNVLQFQQKKLKLDRITYKNGSGDSAIANVVTWED